MEVNNIKYIKRFEENLEIWNEENDKNYTFEDVQDKFIDIRLLGEKNKENKKESKCMCGHKILYEYEITNPDNDDKMILGSDCIETYMFKSMSKCEKCEKRFKFNPNNDSNRCKDCIKVKVKCKRCNEIRKIPKYKKKSYKLCKKCIEEKEEKNRIKEKKRKKE